MGQILGLITGKIKTLADACDRDALLRKHKAITALLPYAVWQERDKEYPILDVLLHAARQSLKFRWRRVRPFLNTLLNDTSHASSKRALMLASPYMGWHWRGSWEGLARAWAAAASTVPKEEAIAPSVANTLFQIAFRGLLPPHLYGDAWSWLTLWPSLPPVSRERLMQSHPNVVQTVRDLGDIEILKSYLLLIWSEWDTLHSDGYLQMQISIHEDFSGIKMSSRRTDLLQRLDHVLGQLDRGLEHFQQEEPRLNGDDLQKRKDQYERLMEILLEVDQEALEVLTRASPRSTTLSNYPLTQPHTGSHSTFMCALPTT